MGKVTKSIVARAITLCAFVAFIAVGVIVGFPQWMQVSAAVVTVSVLILTSLYSITQWIRGKYIYRGELALLPPLIRRWIMGEE